MLLFRKILIALQFATLCLISSIIFAKNNPVNTENYTNKYPDANLNFLGRCNSEMTQEQYQELLKESDISTFSNYYEAAPRVQRIAEIFAQAKDRRGIFSTMYVEITKESVSSSERGAYHNNEKSAELIKRFAERYFEPLHAYLRNGSENAFGINSIHYKEKYPIVSEWRAYFLLAEDCRTSDLRLLGAGSNSHLSIDLPYALSEIRAPETFKQDFMKFGDILIQKKRASTNLLIEQQNVYAASFFDLFFIGKFIDGFAPDGTAATWGFQLIRAEAWYYGQSLQVNGIERVAESGMRAAWRARQLLLSIMPHSSPEMRGTEE
jgi:hypothetical protein